MQQECKRALLVTVGHFQPGVPLRNRPGAKQDTKRLHRVLSKLGFKVELHNDLSSTDIYQLIHTEARRPVRDCFLCVLSSHGEEGCVFGADGKPVHLSMVLRCFDTPLMEPRTKVFLVQACRGGRLDDGVEVDSGGPGAELSLPQDLSVPMDSAVMYASAPGHGAFQHPLSGSFFLQSFCALLEDECCRQLELTRLLTRLSHRVAYGFQAKGQLYGGKKQMPCLLSTLTRDVFPFAQPAKEGGAAAAAAALSATLLVGRHSTRTRTRSIS